MVVKVDWTTIQWILLVKEKAWKIWKLMFSYCKPVTVTWLCYTRLTTVSLRFIRCGILSQRFLFCILAPLSKVGVVTHAWKNVKLNPDNIPKFLLIKNTRYMYIWYNKYNMQLKYIMYIFYCIVLFSIALSINTFITSFKHFQCQVPTINMWLQGNHSNLNVYKHRKSILH